MIKNAAVESHVPVSVDTGKWCTYVLGYFSTTKRNPPLAHCLVGEPQVQYVKTGRKESRRRDNMLSDCIYIISLEKVEGKGRKRKGISGSLELEVGIVINSK